jgi:hypothetical protein
VTILGSLRERGLLLTKESHKKADPKVKGTGHKKTSVTVRLGRATQDPKGLPDPRGLTLSCSPGGSGTWTSGRPGADRDTDHFQDPHGDAHRDAHTLRIAAGEAHTATIYLDEGQGAWYTVTLVQRYTTRAASA